MGKENENIISEENKTTTDAEEKDLQKALDENLETMNNLIKAKQGSLTKKDVEEMMKDKGNKKLFKEYMKKGSGKDADEDDEDGDDDEDDEYEEKGKGVKKSFESIEQNAEVVDAIPIIKDFYDIQKSLLKSIKEINEKVETLQKAIEDNNELAKSFASVLTSQSELLKSINGEVEVIGNTPLPKKGKIDKNDILKSGLEGEENKPLPIGKVKEILIKSCKDGDIPLSEISKWEQTGYNLGVLQKSTLAMIESKLK